MKHILVLLLAIGCSQVEEAEKQKTQTEAKSDVRELNVAKATPEEKAAIERYKRKVKQEKLDNAKKEADRGDEYMAGAAERRQKSAQVKLEIGIDLEKRCDSKAVFVRGFARFWLIELPGVGTISPREVLTRDQCNILYASLEEMTGGTAKENDTVRCADFFRHTGQCD